MVILLSSAFDRNMAAYIDYGSRPAGNPQVLGLSLFTEAKAQTGLNTSRNLIHSCTKLIELICRKNNAFGSSLPEKASVAGLVFI